MRMRTILPFAGLVLATGLSLSTANAAPMAPMHRNVVVAPAAASVQTVHYVRRHHHHHRPLFWRFHRGW